MSEQYFVSVYRVHSHSTGMFRFGYVKRGVIYIRVTAYDWLFVHVIRGR